MFKDNYRMFIESKLIEIQNEIKSETGEYLSVHVASEADFMTSEMSNDEIYINTIFGGASKIEGAPDSHVINFSLDIFGELGDGTYAEKISHELFEALSMQENKVNDYQTFALLSSPQVTDPFLQSGASYRTRLSMVGTVIYSLANLLNANYYISINDNEYSKLLVIAPQSSRDNNIETKVVSGGILTISNGTVYSGTLSIILKKDVNSKLLFGYLHGVTNINSLKIKIEFDEMTAEHTNLTITNLSTSFDEETRSTILSISFIGDGING